MDPFTPRQSNAKLYVIAGSIAAVVVGLIVVGVIAYRSKALSNNPNSGPSATSPVPPNNQPASPSPAVPGTPAAAPTSAAVIQKADEAKRPPDFSNGPDADGDGLSDQLEAIYGTDPNKKDTDGDGLTDYDEIYVYGTDPLNPKSNATSGDGRYSPNKGQAAPKP